jgi:Ca-activated chloride channel homolog
MRLSDRAHILLFFCLLAGMSLWAQNDAKDVYYGNKLYYSGKTIESTDLYRQALKENPHNQKAYFNLGNSLYKNALQIKASKQTIMQGKNKVSPDSLANLVFDEAAQNFANVANTISDKDTLHRAWHNIGNCYLQKKDYQQAVDAYKKSLKYNPKDEETRYNLAYALKHMPKDKKGGGGGGGKPQNKEDKQDQKKNSAPQQGELSKEQAEQLLKALMNSEKKLQDKRKQKPEDMDKNSVEKDW